VTNQAKNGGDSDGSTGLTSSGEYVASIGCLDERLVGGDEDLVECSVLLPLVSRHGSTTFFFCEIRSVVNVLALCFLPWEPPRARRQRFPTRPTLNAEPVTSNMGYVEGVPAGNRLPRRRGLGDAGAR